MRPERPRRRGFTLVEILVALALSAVVVLGARMLLEQLADSAHRTVTGAARSDRDANAEQLLRELTRRIEVGTAGAAHFAGEPDSARFTSWCEVPPGWQERCVVRLRIGRTPQGATLSVFAPGTPPQHIRAASVMELRYLDDASAGGRWFRSWGAGITAPIAIGLVADGDTTILRIGGRG